MADITSGYMMDHDCGSGPKATTLADVLITQIDWSRRTFGEGKRTAGITAHIAKELDEIRADPSDLTEWIDVIILAMDGYWRHGGMPANLLEDIRRKQAINLARRYPKPTTQDEPVEHIRDEATDA